MRSMRHALGLILVVTIIGLCPRAVAIAAPATQLVDATLLADTAAVEPGRPFTVGVLLKIQPKWHVYWKNPGDSGIATTVDFAVPEGFTVGDLQFPVPQRLNLAGGLVSFGYEDEVMLLATVVPPNDLRTGASV